MEKCKQIGCAVLNIVGFITFPLWLGFLGWCAMITDVSDLKEKAKGNKWLFD